MKKTFQVMLVTAALVCWTHAQAPVLSRMPSGPVNDFAGVLSAGAKAQLARFSTAIFDTLGVAIVVATTPSLDGDDIDDVTNRLYEKWGVGAKGRDEGALILVAVNDRRIRIETGYGSEGYITDAHAADIIRRVAAPYLRQDRWDEGIAATVTALAALAAAEKNVDIRGLTGGGSQKMRVPRQGRDASPLGGVILFLFILFLVFTPAGRAILPWLLIAGLGSSHRSFGSGRGFGGGFGGGGFGGFGGGMSGGGGASGRF